MQATRPHRSATETRIWRKLSGQMAELENEGIFERIRLARKRAGLSQQEAADAIHVRVRTYQHYESDRVPWYGLGKIAEAFGTTKEWLLHGDETPGQQPLSSELLEAMLENNALLRRLLDERKRDADDG